MESNNEPIEHAEDAHDSEKSSCCSPKTKKFFSLTKENASPIPWRVLMLVFLPLLASCYTISYIFPYVPSMVLYFGYKEEEKGYYAGILGSAFFLGRMLGCYFWGWLSDRRGRKPVLIGCSFLICFGNLGFGFVGNIWWASAVRVLVGMCNGHIAVVKSIIYEVSDDTNHSFCLGIISVSWGLGTVLAPLISGYVAEPVGKYPRSFAESGIFGQFPFLLPSLIASAVCFFTILPVICKLPETSHRHRNKVIEEIEVQPENETEPAPVEQDSLLTPVSKVGNGTLKSKPLFDPTYRHSVMIPLKDNPRHSTNLGDGDVLYPLPWLDDQEIYYADSGFTDDYSKVYGYGCFADSYGNLLTAPDMYPSLQRKRRSWRSSLSRSLRSLSKSRSLRSDQTSKSLRSFSQDPLKPTLAMPESSMDLSLFEIPDSTAHMLPAHSVILSEIDKVHYTPKKIKPKKECCCAKCKSIDFFRLLSQKDVCMAVMLYTTYAMAVIGFEEVYTVWTSTERDLAGLGFNTEQIGNTIGISSIPLLVLHIFMFPFIESKIGAKMTFVIFCVVLIVLTVLTPCLRFLKDGSTEMWGLLLAMNAVMRLAASQCFASSSIFVNNSARSEDVGKVNGISVVFTAIGRFLGPLLGGSIYAWSISYGVKIGFPFDVNCIFILIGLIYLAANIFCAFTPATLDRQKKEQPQK